MIEDEGSLGWRPLEHVVGIEFPGKASADKQPEVKAGEARARRKMRELAALLRKGKAAMKEAG